MSTIVGAPGKNVGPVYLSESIITTPGNESFAIQEHNVYDFTHRAIEQAKRNMKTTCEHDSGTLTQVQSLLLPCSFVTCGFSYMMSMINR